MRQKGIFITFEGPEGAGKSTQMLALKNFFQITGRELVFTREPGGTEVAEKLREIVKHHVDGEPIVNATELLLFAASRAQHVHNLIRPALARGAIVVCDRFADSTTAYQGYGRGLDLEFIRQLNQFATCGCRPDLTILLDLSPAKSCERRTLRQAALFDQEQSDRIEAESQAFHERVRNGFLAIARNEPRRVKIVNAELTPDVVRQHLMEILRHEFKLFR